jgi:hypothetical protein
MHGLVCQEWVHNALDELQMEQEYCYVVPELSLEWLRRELLEAETAMDQAAALTAQRYSQTTSGDYFLNSVSVFN